jgi:uncharacterized NAD(P)/FAD-binding protein YdhS
MTEARTFDVAIVGGGFAGAAVAYHLARLRPATSIVVFEPRDFLGGGLAYDDADPAHRINVPATRMSLIPGDDGHFARWLADTGAGGNDPDIVGRDGFLYPRRAVFGRYAAAQLDPLIRAGQVTHVKAKVQALEPARGHWSLSTGPGAPYRARVAVLATTHPAPEAPPVVARLSTDPRVIGDPLAPGALAGIGPDERVVILGTGLTMADVVASLDRQGHRGPIVALSRRGLRSRGHAKSAAEPFGDFASAAPRASAFLRQIRLTLREAAARGLSWHSVIDAVRAQAQTFWGKLSPQDQSRIVRHLRVYWDVHRFRIAPQVEDVLDRRTAEGTLRVLAASLVDASAGAGAIDIAVRRRGQDVVEHLAADRVVVTTGPAHHKILATQPYLAALSAAGRIAADHLKLGIAVDADSRALDNRGTAGDGTLFVAGPLARARFGELMGLPQVAENAQSVAEQVSRLLGAAGIAVRDAAEVG